jgi:peptidoglycan lytic transglycosylase
MLSGLVGGVALAAPHGGTGGVGLGGSGTTSTGPTQTSGGVSTAPTISASANGITLKTTATAVASQKLRFSGTAPNKATVVVEEQVANARGWKTIATTKAGKHGRFSVNWTARQHGRVSFSAIAVSSAAAGVGANVDAAGTPPLTVDIVKAYVATFYGPGFWGSTVACRQDGRLVKLKPNTLGVASHTNVKCGTKVTFYYQGKQITVPVIDREGSDSIGTWDLTEKTAKDLGISETVTVGASWR